MANYGDIPSNITIAAGETIRRNAGNTAFEAFTPGVGVAASTTEVLTGTDATKVVTPDVLAALWEQGSNVASATTISLGEGGYFNITGTTTITDIDFATDKAGRRAWLKFAGALTLTHNASTLILPTGANITTVAGDTAEFISEGTDVVRCVSYQRASGSALVDSSGTAATTTEALTGTDTTKFITADALAAVWEAGSDIASAGTITVGEGGQFNITGTTTITDIDFGTDKTGRTVWFKFAGALTLTHNPTTLILSSSRFASDASKNITTAAGDIACFRSEGSDVVRLLHYQRAANFPRTQKEVYLEQFGHTNSGLAAAISAISTTRTKLVVTEDLTVSTSQTIPTTCVLEIRNNALITISSSATLTIGKFADPGNVQCFAGVDASNHVVFSAGAVEKFNLAWYMGIGSTSDCTYAMTDIFTSITTAKGGTVFVPPGSWKVNDLNCPNGLRLEGVGQGNDGSSDIGSRFIPRDGSTAYLFRTYRDYRNFSSAHIAFSVGTNTTTRAFRMEGSSGYSGFGVAFDHCTFIGNGATSHYPLVSDDNDQVYEIMRANFYDCQFMVANGSKGVYIKSVNTQFGFIGCSFIVGTGDSFGIDGYNAGLTVLNCDFRGASGSFNDAASTIATLTGSITSGTAALTTTSGLTKAMEGQRVYNASGLATGFYIKCVHSSTSATLSGNATSTITGGSITVYKWGDGTGRAGCAIRVASGALLTSTIDSCADEGFNYFLRVIGGSLDTPVRLTNNKIQSKIYAENSTVFYANGNEFYSNVWGIASGQVAHVYGENTYWDNTVEMAFSNPLTYAKPWGPERGGQFYFHDEGFMANAGGHTADRQGFWKEILETTSGSLTRPLLGVYTTYEDSSSNRQLLQQWGVKDAQGQQVVKYGLNLSRDVYTSPGYYLWESTQDAPYKGWQTDFPTGYGTACRGTVTQGTSRTTGVTLAAAHGIITCYTYAGTVLAPGETISFTLTNSFIQNSDFFHVAVIDNATSQYTKAWSSDCGGGVATINIKNEHLSNNENASALKLAFYIVKNGGQAGISV